MKIGDKILTELDKQGKHKKELAEYIGGEPASISDWNDSDLGLSSLIPKAYSANSISISTYVVLLPRSCIRFKIS